MLTFLRSYLRSMRLYYGFVTATTVLATAVLPVFAWRDVTHPTPTLRYYSHSHSRTSRRRGRTGYVRCRWAALRLG